MIQISCWFYPEIDLLVFWNVEIKWILTENMYFYFGPTSAQNNEEFASLMLILTWNGLVSIMKIWNLTRVVGPFLGTKLWETANFMSILAWNGLISILKSWNKMDSYEKYFYFAPASAQNYEEFAGLMLILTWNWNGLNSLKSFESRWSLGQNKGTLPISCWF